MLAKEKIGSGADAVKIFAGSWLGGDMVATMPLEIVDAIRAEAHGRGKLVLAQVLKVSRMKYTIRLGKIIYQSF